MKCIPKLLKNNYLTSIIKGMLYQTPMGTFFRWRQRVYYNGYRIYTIARIHIYSPNRSCSLGFWRLMRWWYMFLISQLGADAT